MREGKLPMTKTLFVHNPELKRIKVESGGQMYQFDLIKVAEASMVTEALPKIGSDSSGQ